jgi:hypothetical protein
MTASAGEIVVYTDPDGMVQVRLEEGSVWLSQAPPTELRFEGCYL